MKSMGSAAISSITAVSARNAASSAKHGQPLAKARFADLIGFCKKLTKAVGGNPALGCPRRAPPRWRDASP